MTPFARLARWIATRDQFCVECGVKLKADDYEACSDECAREYADRRAW